jgi:hypothetical protein
MGFLKKCPKKMSKNVQFEKKWWKNSEKKFRKKHLNIETFYRIH